MKTEFTAERNQKLVVIKTSRRLARNPRAANVDHQRSMRLQRFAERFTKRLEPLDVIMSVDVSVVFLANKAKRRAGHDQIDRMIVDLRMK